MSVDRIRGSSCSMPPTPATPGSAALHGGRLVVLRRGTPASAHRHDEHLERAYPRQHQARAHPGISIR